MPAVTVHRCILAARSGFFRALLQGPMADAGHTELTLKVHQYQTIKVARYYVVPGIKLQQFFFVSRSNNDSNTIQ